MQTQNVDGLDQEIENQSIERSFCPSSVFIPYIFSSPLSPTSIRKHVVARTSAPSAPPRQDQDQQILITSENVSTSLSPRYLNLFRQRTLQPISSGGFEKIFGSMENIFHQPGFRFHPTEVELVMYYLRKKVNGKRFRFDAIAEVKVYDFAPWELKEKSCLRSRDLEWYFFCARDKKYASGKRTNRATKYGFWKTTGEDKHISHKFKTVGRRKTLIFYEGKAPEGNRTDWVMHEYRIEDDGLINAGFSKCSYVVCKVFKKSGRGPKNGEQHGAAFDENEWNDDDSEENGASAPLTELSSAVLGPVRSEDLAINPVLDQLPQQSGAPVVTEAPDSILGYDDVEFIYVDPPLSEVRGEGGSCNEEKLDAPIPQENGNKDAMCDGYEIYGGLEDLLSNEELNIGCLGDLGYTCDPIEASSTFWDGSFLEKDNVEPMQDDLWSNW